MKNIDFYNILSSDYDSMISFDTALTNRIKLLAPLIPKHAVTSADLGCGSGIDLISLSQLGLKVVGFDPSEKMLNYAREKCNHFGTENIKLSEYAIKHIPELYHGKFDLITSLGNTISNIPPEDISDTFSKMINLLNKKGKLIIQVVNYDRLINDDERILNIKSSDGKTYIRFYDFLESHINFNILSFEMEKSGKHNLLTTKVYNYKADYLEQLIASMGFKNINVYGDLSLSQYNQRLSKDIVVIAEN